MGGKYLSEENTIKLIATTSLLLVLLLSVSCVSGRSFDRELRSIVKSYRFSIVGWEFSTMLHEAGQWLRGHDKNPDNGSNTVAEYLARGSRIKVLKSELAAGNKDAAMLQLELNKLEAQQSAFADIVASVIKRQIEETLAEQGIYHPWYQYIRLTVTFPPPDLKLEPPPHLLVISPRDKIQTIKTVTLRQDISLSDMAGIEARVDKLNVSSLIVELGGLGTYPSLVSGDASLQFILETVAHEWLHQYLAFTPLGFRYLLDVTGVARNYDIATMNETVANMVGREIGAMVCKKYYPGQERSAPPPTRPAFDFDQEMRDIRKSVDQYLARGEIELAETYMAQKRDYLASQGYHIRKLNQAYFAFHGRYADVPAFISPIGLEIRALRAKSRSVRDFLDTVASMTSRQDLKLAVEPPRS